MTPADGGERRTVPASPSLAELKLGDPSHEVELGRVSQTQADRASSGSRCCRRERYFGVLPNGTPLESPCHKFYLQLIEPPPGPDESHRDEGLVCVGLGTRDVPAAVRALAERGIVFVDRGGVQPSDRGALTQVYLGSVTFELVVSHL